MYKELLKNKILNKKAKIGIIGLGYVGLPLAVEIAKAGFDIIGLDVSKDKVLKLREGISYVGDVPSEAIKEILNSK